MVRWSESLWVRWAALAAILLLAAFLRLWQIDRIPPGFHFDESFEGLEAWRILIDPAYRPIFLTGNFGVPPLNAYANALTFAVVGWLGGEAGPTAMRVTAAIFGVLGVWATLDLGQEMRRRAPDLISPAFPWLAAASLAGMRWHLHFSRMGIEPVMVPLFWALATGLLLRSWRTGAWWAYGSLGITLALGMYAYQSAWIIPLLVALTALHLLWADRTESDKRSRRWTGLIMAGLISVAGLLPLILFFLQQPDLLLMRPAQISVVGQTASPADSTLLDAAWATAKMFGPFGSPGDLDPRRNIPGAPALNLWQAIPFYGGLLIALWQSRRIGRSQNVIMALPVIGLLGLLLPGMISEYAPHFHRILGAAAPAALLCGIGLDAGWRVISGVRSARVRFALIGPLVAGLLLVGGTITSAHDYFVRWANLPDLFYAFDEGLWQLGQWVADQQSGSTIYISPQGENHATLAFAWRKEPAEAQPIRYDGRYVLPLTAGENQHPEQYAVIEHEDFRSRLLLPGVFPTITTDFMVRDAAGQLYAQVYTRPAATLPARTPRFPLEVAVGDGISLVGYDLLPEVAHVGGPLYIQYHWQVTEPPRTDWTVFSHLVDSSGSVVTGFDSPPGRGSLVTTRWQPGWRVLDEVELALPADLPSGEYILRMGLYDASGNQLPAAGTRVELGSLTLLP
ncbi:MAG: hypothetical protein IT328_12160 [Caldilineaceae bacterium]|nr:hypothetical protein [Caldilineaceae bacterium]